MYDCVVYIWRKGALNESPINLSGALPSNARRSSSFYYVIIMPAQGRLPPPPLPLVRAPESVIPLYLESPEFP